jgi:hypothetical protein
LHLSTVNLLGPYLTYGNSAELLTAACGLTKRQTEAMLAARFPKVDVAPSLRRLPVRRPAACGDEALPLLAAPAMMPGAALPTMPAVT